MQANLIVELPAQLPADSVSADRAVASCRPHSFDIVTTLTRAPAGYEI